MRKEVNIPVFSPGPGYNNIHYVKFIITHYSQASRFMQDILFMWKQHKIYEMISKPFVEWFNWKPVEAI